MMDSSETRLLVSHAEDLAERARRDGSAATKFLTPAEMMEICRHFNSRKDISLNMEGGYAGAERVRMVFLNPDWGSYEPEEVIAGIRVEFRQQDLVEHRDILGALMNLGIARETVGDIEAGGNPATFVCLPEIASYILENLEKIGRVGVRLARIPITELPLKMENLAVREITLSSLRLDSLVGGLFNLSRSQASLLIGQGKVSVNHWVCLKQDQEIEAGSVISVRGKGRGRLLEVEGPTRKARLKVKVGIYE